MPSLVRVVAMGAALVIAAGCASTMAPIASTGAPSPAAGRPSATSPALPSDPSSPTPDVAAARARPKVQTRRHSPPMLVESHASATTIQAQPAPGSCHATGSGPFALPDRHCTPGALNPAVDPADIRSTICVPGYSESVRPPEAVTEPEKYASLAAYGDPSDPGGYEYDHLVPLELGGAPNDPRNLWPEPGASPNPKDSLEDRLHEMVCAGDISLTVAQHEIATDWVAAYRRDVGPIRPTAPVRPTGGGGAWCHASAKPANDGYPGDYEVTVTSDQPDAKALASDAGDRWYQYTDALGGAEIRLYRTTTGEQIIVTVGAVTCTTRA